MNKPNPLIREPTFDLNDILEYVKNKYFIAWYDPSIHDAFGFIINTFNDVENGADYLLNCKEKESYPGYINDILTKIRLEFEEYMDDDTIRININW